MRVMSGLISFFIVYIISTSIHEIGHFIGFVHNNVDVRMLSIHIFSFIYDGVGWKFTINRNSTNIGGIVVPNLKVINNYSQFKEIQKSYSRAILGGPIASLILLIAGIIMNIYRQVIIIGMSMTLVNTFILMGCFLKNQYTYGDFLAYKEYKEDDFFATLMLYLYASFSIDYKKVIRGSTYLRELLLEYLLPRINSLKVDLLTVTCVSTYILQYLVEIIDVLPEEMIKYIEYYYDNYLAIIEHNNGEANKQLLLYISYFFNKEGYSDRAIEIYDNFTLKLPQSEVFDYWKIQSEQMILYQDNSSYLLNKNNIKPNSNYNTFKRLEGFYYYDMLLNKKIDVRFL